MLSYRHAFHAGNFADVLKHLILVEILTHLKKKDSPFCYIDTHAGAGKYHLHGDYALQTREFENGIGKLWQHQDLPDSVANYVNVVKQFNNKPLTHYPGSPMIAKKLLRPNDRLVLFELHSTDFALLAHAVNKDKRIKLFHSDGFQECLKLLPPHERRGLLLIDPSYEIKSDYRQVAEMLLKMHRRFATGTYAVWYPVIDRRRNQQLEKTMAASGIKNVQLFELGIKADTDSHGMTGSGMIVVNPPWTLAAQMQVTLPWLTDILGNTVEGYYRIQTLVDE
ncbi:MAG: 23S rRNA (adenine(2030)-N(6))-methyltransferase RlmJ [Methylococcaceae bacterium]|nr:23S rRNA (adenine(2030)-N(6))-methyltransferase RlmJ [Methylococcaceae bacterium]